MAITQKYGFFIYEYTHNVDESQKDYVKQTKSDSKGHMVCHSMDMTFLKKTYRNRNQVSGCQRQAAVPRGNLLQRDTSETFWVMEITSVYRRLLDYTNLSKFIVP